MNIAGGGRNATLTVVDNYRYDEWSLLPDVRFIEESAYIALERFPDSSIDICFLNLVLHHLTADSYQKTRDGQRKLLEMIYQKLSPGGHVFIYECCYQNPVLADLSIPTVYYLTTSRIPFITKFAKHFGSKSAGIGVCFLSRNVWIKTFLTIGYSIIRQQDNPWRWVRQYLIRSKFFWFVLSKT